MEAEAGDYLLAADREAMNQAEQAARLHRIGEGAIVRRLGPQLHRHPLMRKVGDADGSVGTGDDVAFEPEDRPTAGPRAHGDSRAACNAPNKFGPDPYGRFHDGVGEVGLQPQPRGDGGIEDDGADRRVDPEA
jgi:hypothetical protein